MTLRRIGAVLVLGLAATAASAALPTPDPDNGAIKLPAGFRALVVADDLGRLRFLTVAPNGDVYVKTRDGGIIALRDKDGDGRAEIKETFGEGGGTGIAIHDGWLYHSTNSAVLRYRYTPGELVPKGPPQTVVSGLSYARQHGTKSFAFDDQGRLLVEVGSPSNAYGGENDRKKGAAGEDPTEFLKKHGGFWRFDPNKLNQTQADGHHFSTGHRHMIPLAWNPVSKAFFSVMHGRDVLNIVAPEYYTDDDNAELPAEEMHILREGNNYGWPFTYYDPIRKARMLAPEYGGDKQKRAEPGRYPDPLIAFPAHWAPMQMAFYTGSQFPQKYRGGAFLAFHGSWNRAPKPQKGYNVVYIPFDAKGMPRGDYEVFADGFTGKAEIASPNDARFRPNGVGVGPDGSLYVSDSQKGRVWRIIYTGEKPAAAPEKPAGVAARNGESAGFGLYKNACAPCHMLDGKGVPGLQPPLVGSATMSGDATTAIDVMLRGPREVLKSRGDYANDMPAFANWSDEDIAAVLSYVRKSFGGGGAVSAAQVAARRSKSSWLDAVPGERATAD
jgi:glucose/arabinose dehydrogenase